MRVIYTCGDCGKVIEKDGADQNLVTIAETMVSYLARRHREKTDHKESAIVKKP